MHVLVLLGNAHQLVCCYFVLHMFMMSFYDVSGFQLILWGVSIGQFDCVDKMRRAIYGCHIQEMSCAQNTSTTVTFSGSGGGNWWNRVLSQPSFPLLHQWVGGSLQQKDSLPMLEICSCLLESCKFPLLLVVSEEIQKKLTMHHLIHLSKNQCQDQISVSVQVTIPMPLALAQEYWQVGCRS